MLVDRPGGEPAGAVGGQHVDRRVEQGGPSFGVASHDGEIDPGLTLTRGLKAEPGADIWLCGGAALAGQLLGEIDELVLRGTFEHGRTGTTYRPA